MKVYKSMLINNIPHSVVAKKVYGGDVFWVVIKGGHFKNEILCKFDSREMAVKCLLSLCAITKTKK